MSGRGEERKVYKVLLEKPEGKRPLGRWGVWIGFDWLRTGTGGGLL
jgi:hypothetical protein